MALDITEDAGSFRIYGVTSDRRSVLIRVEDYRSCIYVDAPVKQATEDQQYPETRQDLRQIKDSMNMRYSSPFHMSFLLALCGHGPRAWSKIHAWAQNVYLIHILAAALHQCFRFVYLRISLARVSSANSQQASE